MKLCLSCGKRLTGRVTAGCHNACYQRLWRDMRDGITTKAELIKAGKILADKPGPKRKER